LPSLPIHDTALVHCSWFYHQAPPLNRKLTNKLQRKPVSVRNPRLKCSYCKWLNF